MSRSNPLSSNGRIALSLFSACAIALGATSQDAQADPAKQLGKDAQKMQNAASSAGNAMKQTATEAVQDAVSGVAELGKTAPKFVLTDTDGTVHKLSDLEGKVVVLEWFNPDCPFVKKHHMSNKSMSEAYGAVAGDDVVWFAINSGAPGKQGAGLDRNREAKEQYGIAYPVLLDPSGIVGQAYGAKNTPHMFVIDPAGKLAYEGAIDDNPSPDVLGKTNYVIETVNRVRKGETVEASQTKPYGCSVKYAS